MKFATLMAVSIMRGNMSLSKNLTGWLSANCCHSWV